MYNITDFGAKAGALCTDSIQAAIDECAKNGGGTVTVPAGLYISGTIYLKSNVELNLSHGSVLKASTDMKDYNPDDAYEQNWGSQNEKWRGKHLIVAAEQNNVAITGTGTLDGSGDFFFGTERNFINDYAWEGGYITSRDLEMLRPGQLICFIESTDITVKDISLVNCPCWGLYLYGCVCARIRGIKVTNPFECVNTDGIDIDCCQNVTVSDCIITTGDDAIAVRCSDKRLKTYRPCENIAISNCVLASNSAVFRIGVGTGEIRHVVISGITVSKAGHLITYATSFDGRGNAFISDVIFSDIVAHNVGGAIDGYVFKGGLNNITMKNMHISAKDGICIVRKDDGVVSDIKFKDIRIEITENLAKQERQPVNIVNTEGVTLDSVNIIYDYDGKVLNEEGNTGFDVKNCNF